MHCVVDVEKIHACVNACVNASLPAFVQFLRSQQTLQFSLANQSLVYTCHTYTHRHGCFGNSSTALKTSNDMSIDFDIPVNLR